MKFEEKYTTADKVKDDKTGLESKKVQISNDAYATNELMQEVLNELKKMRFRNG